jgi:hypothetical protein
VPLPQNRLIAPVVISSKPTLSRSRRRLLHLTPRRRADARYPESVRLPLAGSIHRQWPSRARRWRGVFPGLASTIGRALGAWPLGRSLARSLVGEREAAHKPHHDCGTRASLSAPSSPGATLSSLAPPPRRPIRAIVGRASRPIAARTQSAHWKPPVSAAGVLWPSPSSVVRCVAATVEATATPIAPPAAARY